MRLYICGQKAFGAAVLEECVRRGHEVVGISAPLTSSSDPSRPDRLRSAAELKGIPALPAGMLNADTLPDGVDLIVAAHSHDFIGRRTRLKARLGAIGYHPSLLPLHRGRDAIRWAIKMSDRVTGGSIYWLTDTMDGGPIAAQSFVFLPPGETVEGLWREKLFPLGVLLFSRVLADLEAGRIVAVPQDDQFATWEPSWERPPVRRPDLLMIGAGRLDGFTVSVDPDALL